MDDTDQKLMALLASNPRMHLQELAEKLGISKQAVHHRMRALTDEGVFRGTRAGISFAYLNAVPVAVFGRSNTCSVEDTLDTLGESEFTRRVVVAGGNYVYVVGELRDVSELKAYARFVARTASMLEPTVGIYRLEGVPSPDYHVDGVKARKQNYKRLSQLDLKIIASIKNDARKPVTEIAEIVGASTKTVKRCLDDMLSDGSLELHALIDSPLGGEMLSLIHVNLKSGADPAEAARRLLSKYSSLDAYVRMFVNIPDFFLFVFWSDELRKIRAMLGEICGDRDVVSSTLNIGYLERIYETTWRDKLLGTISVGRNGAEDTEGT
jgi:DNA-binding Lrp family transcriptional regulator